MSTLKLDISPGTYQKLAEQAHEAGKQPEILGRELLEAALQSLARSRPQSVQAKGRIRPLGETLRRKILPGVTLDKVRKALNKAQPPSLSAIILARRGPKV